MGKLAIIIMRLCEEAETEGGSNEEIRKDILRELEESPKIPWQGAVERLVVADVL